MEHQTPQLRPLAVPHVGMETAANIYIIGTFPNKH